CPFSLTLVDDQACEQGQDKYGETTRSLILTQVGSPGMFASCVSSNLVRQAGSVASRWGAFPTANSPRPPGVGFSCVTHPGPRRPNRVESSENGPGRARRDTSPHPWP